ncbi:hypothetical protein ACH427_04305 [Streptomyces sp. NPDC020379]|uniref:hypothetical protein n=1 Tax=Streptomyces sp. NPDC020379 TaxID=3365071 RepID=UPI003789BFC8
MKTRRIANVSAKAGNHRYGAKLAHFAVLDSQTKKSLAELSEREPELSEEEILFRIFAREDEGDDK